MGERESKYICQGCMQKFLSKGRGGGKENLSQRAQVTLIFRESRPCLMCSTELTKIPRIFFPFFPAWKEGKGTVKESESVKDIPPYFEQNSQTNPMSVRGEPAATRFIICNFTLPSP